MSRIYPVLFYLEFVRIFLCPEFVRFTFIFFIEYIGQYYNFVSRLSHVSYESLLKIINTDLKVKL